MLHRSCVIALHPRSINCNASSCRPLRSAPPQRSLHSPHRVASHTLHRRSIASDRADITLGQLSHRSLAISTAAVTHVRNAPPPEQPMLPRTKSLPSLTAAAQAASSMRRCMSSASLSSMGSHSSIPSTPSSSSSSRVTPTRIAKDPLWTYYIVHLPLQVMRRTLRVIAFSVALFACIILAWLLFWLAWDKLSGDALHCPGCLYSSRSFCVSFSPSDD